jgi:hypothetical protein
MDVLDAIPCYVVGVIIILGARHYAEDTRWHTYGLSQRAYLLWGRGIGCLAVLLGLLTMFKLF